MMPNWNWLIELQRDVVSSTVSVWLTHHLLWFHSHRMLLYNIRCVLLRRLLWLGLWLTLRRLLLRLGLCLTLWLLSSLLLLL